jgi:hypothetical protein
MNIFWMIKAIRMRWVCSTEGGGEVHAWFCWGNLNDRVYMEDLGIDGKIIVIGC